MSDSNRPSNFLQDLIEADLKAGKNGGQVVTRFPPEPNGFLHIGHSKSILLNFGLSKHFAGRTHLRFDDTNPTTEDTQYVEAIQADAAWLGADWGKHLYYASDFFPRMYECAVRLIKEGKAFVDSQAQDAIREQRGDFGKPGSHSPFRNRPVEENLRLFGEMRDGKFKDGECVLRAKIDMAHPNVLMRDPLLYRIRHAHHHRTGSTWCIYPMYDYAHPLEDAFEGITHSICTLEFESNRELYDWVLDNLGPWNPRPRQYEFARLALGYTVMSKRKLLQLVNEKRVSGWDDPRMPTIAGMRRRGVTAQALRDFNELIGVAKNNSLVDIGKFEFAIRQDLEGRAPRALGVLHPIKVTLTNWPADKVEQLDVPWWWNEPERGSRQVPFGKELLIDEEDFSAEPPKDWKRLAPGRAVRLVSAYVVQCDEVIKGADGKVTELRCTVDLASRSGSGNDGTLKPAGTLHWVHAPTSLPLEVRLYDRLFSVEQPDAEGDFLQHLNPDSLVVAKNARLEPALAAAQPGAHYQLIRQGYFFADPVDSKPGNPVFNRVIGLKDRFTKPAEPAEPKKAAEPKHVPGPKKNKAEHRAELFAAHPEMKSRFDGYQKTHGLSEDEAELLASHPGASQYFDAAVAFHPAPKSLVKWLTNELLGLAGERELSSLPIQPRVFALAVALLDGGKLTAPAMKTLLGSLVERGGVPEVRMRELGLEKVDDAGAVNAAVGRVLESHAAEVARYRAGEKKLFGVLVGAAMKETKGAADAGAVRQALTTALGG